MNRIEVVLMGFIVVEVKEFKGRFTVTMQNEDDKDCAISLLVRNGYIVTGERGCTIYGKRGSK